MSGSDLSGGSGDSGRFGGAAVKGLRLMWPVGLGLIPLGLAFGVLIVQSGFAWWWAPIFTFVIYAGSMEYSPSVWLPAGWGH